MGRNSNVVSVYGSNYGSGNIYGYGLSASVGGNNPNESCPVSCEDLEAVDNYVKQLTRILTNLNRDTKLYIADKALDSMTASIDTRIATLKSTTPA